MGRFTRAAAALFARVPPLEQEAKTPRKDDVASYEHAFITLGPRYNPDQLIGRNGVAIYAKMRLDEQVKAVMNFKRDAITARGWTFKYPDYSALPEEERARRIRIFTEIVNRMRGSFVDSLNVIATGRDYGFSMTEKVYSDVTIEGATYVGLSELRGRDPSTFEFYTDDYGTLLRVEQLVPARRTPIDMTRMIHYVHSPEFDRYFGRSDLREAYRSWYAKDTLVKLWLLYLEKMAGGQLILNPKGEDNPAPDGSATDRSIRAVLQNLHSTSGIKLPPGFDVQLIHPASTDAYHVAIVYFDLAIAKALLVPNLLGISHTGQTGAYAQSQTQLEAFFWTLNADSMRLESVINEQLFRDLGDQNFGDGEYPYFCFRPASREHIKQVIEDWMKLTGAGAVVTTEEDEEHFRKLLDMPKPGGKPLMDPMADRAQTLAEDGQEFDQTMRERQDRRAEEEARRQAQAANDERYAAIRADVAEMKRLLTESRPGPSEKSGGAHKLNGHSVALSRAEQRVHFTVIASRQDRLAEDLTGSLSGFTARAVAKLLGSDADLAKLIDEDPADIADVELSSAQKSRLKDMFRRSLASAWTLGGEFARNEIERARGQRLVRMADLRDKAADYFEVNSFRMAGNVADGVRALIQAELQNSIKFGRTAQATREVIWDRLVARGFTSRASVREVETDPAVVRALNDLWGVSEAQTAAYLDTLARTNLFEAMNEARYAEFTDPALGDFVVALEYSAILDDRTTDICQHLNGKTYREDNPVWDQYRPPNHFNCRSVLVPVTQIDGWDGRESPPPTVQPQAGFGSTLQ